MSKPRTGPVLRVLVAQVLREAANERVFHTAALYVVATALLAPWVSDLSLAAPERAIRDLGLTLAWVVACGVAIWLGIRHVGWELGSRSAALWLIHPVPRSRWLLGRVLGIGAVLGVQITVLVASYAVIAALQGVPTGTALVWYWLLLWAEGCVLASLAGLLGLLVSPALATSSTVALWAAGHLANEYTAATTGTPLLGRLAFALVPDLDLFDLQAVIVHDLPLDPVRTGGALVYGALWVLGLQALALLALERRDAV